MKKKKRRELLRKKYPVIKNGMQWWKSRSPTDRRAFVKGFNKNKHAEEIQSEEVEANRQRSEARLEH